MQPTIAFQGRPIRLVVGDTAVNLFERGEYRSTSDAAKFFNGAPKRTHSFVPYLIKLGTRKTGDEARAILPGIVQEKSLKVGIALHLAAFGLAHPDYPGAEHRDPITAIGDPTEIEGVNYSTCRTMSIFWGPQDGRRVYTFFDCAHTGPLVSYLMIEEIED